MSEESKEIERLRIELARATKRASPVDHLADEFTRLKATWWDVLAQSCTARGIDDPMKLLDEYDRIYGA